MKRAIAFIVTIFILSTPFSAFATEEASIYPYEAAIAEYWFTPAAAEYSGGEAKAQLLMEYSTGKVLFAQNEYDHLPIASVTKVISTLLVMEALDSGKIALSVDINPSST